MNKVDGKIRVKSQTLYEIEVNDEGECISFDVSDIGLQAKFIECFDSINKETNKFSKKEKELLEKIKNERQEEQTELFTKTEKEYIKIQQDFYKVCREIMDKFLGENACQKIFGNANYPKMYIDLFEQLEPHFKQMGVNKEKMQKDLYKKYMSNNKKILK